MQAKCGVSPGSHRGSAQCLRHSLRLRAFRFSSLCHFRCLSQFCKF